MMSSAGASRNRRLAVLVTVVTSVVLAAGPALAHVELRLAAPVQNETVTVPLTEVRLEFSGALQAGGAHSVGLFGPGDVRVDSGVTTQPSENAVMTGVGQLTAAGPYTVRYLVIGSDGHPIEGTYGFVYEGPLVVVAPSPSPSASPSPSPSASVEELESAAPLAAEPDQGAPVAAIVVVAVVAVVAVVGVATAVAISARRGRQDLPPHTS